MNIFSTIIIAFTLATMFGIRAGEPPSLDNADSRTTSIIKIDDLRNDAATLFDRGDYASAIQKMSQAVKEAENTWGPNDSRVADLWD